MVQPPPGPDATDQLPKCFGAACRRGESLCSPSPFRHLRAGSGWRKSLLHFRGSNGSFDGTGAAWAKTQVAETLFICALLGVRMNTGHPCCASSVPIPSCQETQVQPAPSCKKVPSCSSPPLQRRHVSKGGSYISPINVIKRIKLLETASFSFSFYFIREIPTVSFVQMKPRLLSVVQRSREDTLPFNLAR